MARLKTLTFVSILLAVAVLGGPAGAQQPPSVVGFGGIVIPNSSGQVVGDRLYVMVSAQRAPDGSVSGAYNIVHVGPDGHVAGFQQGVVTCLNVVGNTAHLTGPIGRGFAEANPSFNFAGQTVALTVVDNGGADSIGFNISVRLPRPGMPGPIVDVPISPCQPAPFLFPVVVGNYAVTA